MCHNVFSLINLGKHVVVIALLHSLPWDYKQCWHEHIYFFKSIYLVEKQRDGYRERGSRDSKRAPNSPDVWNPREGVRIKAWIWKLNPCLPCGWQECSPLSINAAAESLRWQEAGTRSPSWTQTRALGMGCGLNWEHEAHSCNEQFKNNMYMSSIQSLRIVVC